MQLTKIEKKRLRQMLLLTVAIAVIALLLILAVRGGVHMPCVLYELTGFRCPGCGNTRAVMALVNLDLRRAFSYNLLFLPELFYIGWVYVFCAVNYVKNKRFSYRTPAIAFDICILAALVAWTVIRNILHI